jgi:integrase
VSRAAPFPASGCLVGDGDYRQKNCTVNRAHQPDTINEVEGWLVEGDGKTYSSVRTIQLAKYIAHRLAEHLERTGRTSPDEFLFQAPGGGPVRATNYRYRVYQPAVRAAGLDGRTFHRLRHSAGDHLREEGVDLEVIKNRLGHSSIRVTADVYGSLPTQAEKAAAAALDKNVKTRYPGDSLTPVGA